MLLILPCGSAVQAAEQEWDGLSLRAGIDHSWGDYGHTRSTEILYLPFTLGFDGYPWRAEITLPYLRMTGPGGVIGAGDGGVIVGGSGPKDGASNRHGIRTEQGVGDVIAGLSYALDSLWALPLALDLTGKVKLATADPEKELGTGENDYALQLDVAAERGRFTPFATLGYRIMGDPPELNLQDVWFGSMGLEYQLTPALQGGAVFDYRQATSPDSEPLQELMGYLNWQLDRSWSLNAYGVVGFSDASPAGAIGLQISFTPPF